MCECQTASGPDRRQACEAMQAIPQGNVHMPNECVAFYKWFCSCSDADLVVRYTGIVNKLSLAGDGQNNGTVWTQESVTDSERMFENSGIGRNSLRYSNPCAANRCCPLKSVLLAGY